MIGKIVNGVFYAYIIILALYVSYRTVLGNSYGGAIVKFEKPQKKCVKNQGWTYCSYFNKNTDRRVILYVLPAKGQDHNFWEKPQGYSALLQKHWQYKGGKIPMVVTISFGKTWLVTDFGGKKTDATLSRFTTEVFPTIEHDVGEPNQRFIAGESLGGLNAITLSMAFPKKFRRMVSLCPPLYNISPFDSWRVLVNFAVRTGATPKNILQVVGMGKKYFASNKDWLEFSPVEKIRTVRFSPKQHFYVAAGIKDEFGGFEGTQRFIDGLRRTSVITHWKPHSGGHCAVDIESLTEFLEL